MLTDCPNRKEKRPSSCPAGVTSPNSSDGFFVFPGSFGTHRGPVCPNKYTQMESTIMVLYWRPHARPNSFYMKQVL